LNQSPTVPEAIPDPQIQTGLLTWTATELRDLPWRSTRNPWHVMVSEIMLQQTQVSRVIDRYRDFVVRFPTPPDCAAGSVAEVIELWAGLGYNRRAVNLWKAADAITEQHAGLVPEDLASLLALPGIGPYTARAVLAFAFEQDVGVVDTNVGRLLARWTGASLGAAQAQELATNYVPKGQGWLWNQSLLDFAVAVCGKRNPACERCPLIDSCTWAGHGPDPAVSSAGVSGKQSRFEGSERQVRGRIVEALRQGPLRLADLERFGRSSDTLEAVESIADGLVADGLAAKSHGMLQLPS